MSEVIIERPNPQSVAALGIASWSVWSQEAAVFPWYYEDRETCFLLDGEAIVTPDGGQSVRLVKGDMAIFPAGMSCTWEIRKDVRKHYRLG